MGKKVICELLKKEELTKGIFKFSVRAPEIVENAKPGQFLEIKVSNTHEPFLRRPISIYNLIREEGIVEFIFQVKGKGTTLLSEFEVGDKIDIIGPQGYGTFDVKTDYKSVAIIGGGIGIYPLFELTKELKGNAGLNVYLGFRTKDLVTCEKEFEAIGLNKLVVTTDDVSYKEKGFAIDFMKQDIKEHMVDKIFACGPLPLLKAVKQYAEENNIPCEISLEEKMACGIGACLGCAVKVVSGKEERFGHVCKEGPVFNSKDVEI